MMIRRKLRPAIAGVLGSGALRVVNVGRAGTATTASGSKVGSSSHPSLGLATAHGLRARLPAVINDFEREVLHVGLDLRIVELAAEEALRVEDGVDEVHRGVTDQTLGVRERVMGRGGPLSWAWAMISTRSFCQTPTQLERGN